MAFRSVQENVLVISLADYECVLQDNFGNTLPIISFFGLPVIVFNMCSVESFWLLPGIIWSTLSFLTAVNL